MKVVIINFLLVFLSYSHSEEIGCEPKNKLVEVMKKVDSHIKNEANDLSATEIETVCGSIITGKLDILEFLMYPEDASKEELKIITRSDGTVQKINDIQEFFKTARCKDAKGEHTILAYLTQLHHLDFLKMLIFEEGISVNNKNASYMDSLCKMFTNKKGEICKIDLTMKANGVSRDTKIVPDMLKLIKKLRASDQKIDSGLYKPYSKALLSCEMGDKKSCDCKVVNDKKDPDFGFFICKKSK